MNRKYIVGMLVVISLAACGKKQPPQSAIQPKSLPAVKATATGSHSVALTWTASTTTGVQYIVFRNNASVGTINATSYTDSGLPASTTFSYQIAAICATCAPGTNGQSDLAPATPISVTTLPDVTPPPPPTTYPYSPGFNPKSLGFAYTIGGTLPSTGTSHVIDTSVCPPPAGVPTCNWPAIISSDSAWLSATPVNGTTAFYITVKVNPAGMAAGTYHGNIIATISQFTTPTANLPITLVITGAAPPPPLTLTCANNVCTVGGGVSGQTGTIQIVPGGPTATWKKP